MCTAWCRSCMGVETPAESATITGPAGLQSIGSSADWGCGQPPCPYPAFYCPAIHTMPCAMPGMKRLLADQESITPKGGGREQTSMACLCVPSTADSRGLAMPCMHRAKACASETWQRQWPTPVSTHHPQPLHQGAEQVSCICLARWMQVQTWGGVTSAGRTHPDFDADEASAHRAGLLASLHQVPHRLQPAGDDAEQTPAIPILFRLHTKHLVRAELCCQAYCTWRLA